jgi:hypothetical protein
MALLPPRDLRTEIDKHFHGTAEARILGVLRLGDEAVELFCAMSPSVPADQARAIMQRNKQRGRRPSVVAGTR